MPPGSFRAGYRLRPKWPEGIIQQQVENMVYTIQPHFRIFQEQLFFRITSQAFQKCVITRLISVLFFNLPSGLRYPDNLWLVLYASFCYASLTLKFGFRWKQMRRKTKAKGCLDTVVHPADRKTDYK